MTTSQPNDSLFVPHRLTPASPREVFDALHEAWRAVIVTPNPSNESLLVLLAQWGIETGNGRSLHNYNLGNAKRIKGEPWTMLNHVWEIIEGRRVIFEPPHPQTHFRAFASLAEGAREYLEMMHQRFAASWPEVLEGDAAGFAHALKRQRYYTADEHAYARALKDRYTFFEEQIFPINVQAALQALNYADVRAFQKAHGLTADGIAGPKTRAALRRALAQP